MAFVLTSGERHEVTVFERLLSQGAVKRQGRGRPRIRPKGIVGDKAYSSKKVRRHLRSKGIRATIPKKRHEKRRGAFNKELYRSRSIVEMLVNRLKQYRRIATRYEKRGANYLAMVTIVAILLWL